MKINIFIISIICIYCSNANAQFLPDFRLTNDASPSYVSLNNARCIASNGNNIHVVWYDYRIGNSSRIFYKRSTDGGINWSADTNITNSNQTSANPSVAVEGSVVHIVWEDTRIAPVSNSEIYYRRSTDNGVTWGPEFRLSSLPDFSEHPSVSVSGQLVFVVWHDEMWGDLEVFCKRSTDGGTTWGADTRLTNGAGYSAHPSTVISGSNIHLVWFDDKDGNEEIYYKRSTDAGTSWGAESRLTNNTSKSDYPSIHISGSFIHLVWREDRDGVSNTEIYYKRSADEGVTWGADTRITNNSGYSDIASVFSSGQAVHVVWYDDRDGAGNTEIYYKRSTDGGTSWESDTRLTNNSSSSIYPSLTVSGSSVHVVWYDRRDGTYPEIYYKRNPTGNSIGITPISSEIPNGFSLSQNYPNPFNPSTNIEFAIPKSGLVKLKVFDLLGGEIETLVNENLKAGIYEADFDASGLSTGIYFYRLEAGNYSETKKMMLIK